MSAALAVALKDLRLLMRDRMALFWVLLFPTLFGGLLGALLKAAFEQKVSSVVVYVAEVDGSPLTEQVIEHLDAQEGIELVRASSKAGTDALRQGEAIAAIRVVPILAEPAKSEDRRSLPAGKHRIEVEVDPTQPVAQNYLRAALLRSIESTFADASPLDVRITDSQAREAPPSWGYALVFPAALLWGLIGSAASFAVAMVAERNRGTFRRLCVGPIGTGRILLGKAIACFAACLLSASAFTAFGLLVFDVQIDDPLGFSVVIVSAAAAFSGLTMMISVIGNSETAVGGAGWAFLVLLAMIGGGMVPALFMPEWMQELSQLSPVRWGVEAIEGVTWRKQGLEVPLKRCAALWAVGAMGFGFGWLGLQRKLATGG